eukprot:477540_1
MFTLPTIIEQPILSNKAMFCSTFDFGTLSLGTEMLTKNELEHTRRFLCPTRTISKYPVEEYSNTKTNTIITIISLTPRSLKKYMNGNGIKVPTLNGTRSIYLNKIKSDSGEYYLHICFANKC